MKMQSPATVLIVAVITTVQLSAQDVQTLPASWDEVRKGQMIKKVQLKKEALTLAITGIPSSEKIQVYFGKQPQDKQDGETSNNTTSYVLNEFIEDLGQQGEWFFIHDKKRDKDIDSFLLSTAAPETPEDSPAEADEVPIAFYDAQAIYTYYLQHKKLPAWIFAKYNFVFPDTDSAAVLKKNIFIDTFLNRYKNLRGKVSKTEAAEANSLLGGALAGLGGIDVTKYVQATADFLRDRVKEELALAFIDKFKATIESIPELKALLPKTYNVFQTNDLFKVPSLGQTYKTAFREDLEAFVENLERLVDTAKKFENTLRKNETFTAFRIAYHTISMSASDFHPIDIFDNLDARFGLNSDAGRTSSINRYVSLLNLLSQHLRKKQFILIAGDEATMSNGWIDIDDLRKFDPKAMLIFWGLLYQQRHEVFDDTRIGSGNLTKIIIKGTTIIHTTTSTVQTYLKQFVTLANNIDERIKEFKTILRDIRSKTEEVKNMAIQDFIANAVKLTEITDFIFRLPYLKDELSTAFFTSDYYVKWRPVIIDVIETTKGVYAKDYAKISINAASLFNHLTSAQGKDLFSNNFLENFTYYSNFIVDVINADSADDVKAVLTRYAEPVGSYRVKRKTRTSFSVNAYPGIYFGMETYKGESNKTFGVTAPIGFALNWGHTPGKDWSFSVFVNAVDIGAALSYRWSNDTLDLPDKITLGQIFAPGAFIVLGLPKVPIALKLGAQYVPQLRSITKDGNTIEEISTWRYGISASVDIPIFNFYNKSKQKE